MSHPNPTPGTDWGPTADLRRRVEELEAENARLRADLAAVLAFNVRADGNGYCTSLEWNPSSPFKTQAEAGAYYLDYVRGWRVGPLSWGRRDALVAKAGNPGLGPAAAADDESEAGP